MQDLDEALARFQMCAFEYADGRGNVGPMAASAIVALGHPALLGGFVDTYAPRLPVLGSGEVLSEALQVRCRGERGRAADWVATFEARLAEAPFDAVLGACLEALAPGLAAAAGHAWLRAGFALRGVAREPSPIRVRELAFGLAFLAAYQSALPGRLGAGEARRSLSDALDSLATAPPLEDAPTATSCAPAWAEVLAADAAFEAALSSIDPARLSPGPTLSELALASARALLARPAAARVYAHALSFAHASRAILPQLSPAASAAALGDVVKTVFALHRHASSLRAAAPPVDPAERARLADTPAELRYRAACSLHEDAIVFAEACLAEFRHERRADLLLAAADAVLRLDTGRY